MYALRAPDNILHVAQCCTWGVHPMRSHHFAVRFPNPVYEGAVRRQMELPYRTLGKYLTNLVRCDLILQREHDFTKWFCGQSDADQDFVDDCLREFPKSVPGSQPTLTHHFCQGIIAVQMNRHHCTATKALAFLPAAVHDLCTANGFS